MQRRFICILSLCFSFFFQIAHAQKFQCSFISEKVDDGKSNRAICTGSPEFGFGGVLPPQVRNQHCKVEKPYEYYDLTNFLVDLDRKQVSWIGVSGYTKSALAIEKSKQLIKDEIPGKINFDVVKIKEKYDIKNVFKNTEDVLYDSKAKMPFIPPKKLTSYHILFGKGNSTYELYIPSFSGESILTSFHADLIHSYVDMAFGNCRPIK